MPLERTNPISIEVLGHLDTPDRQKIKDDLVSRIKKIDDENRDWLEKQRKLIRLRFGPRPHRKIPWEGAHNISVPLTDSISRRFRPGISSLFLDANPVAFFTSPDDADFDPARAVEPFFNWMTRDQMQMDKQVLRLVALYSDRGHGYAREGWNYKTQKYTRVVSAEALFPQGIQAFLQNAELEHEQLGTGKPFIPENAVIQILEQEYGMSIDDDTEAPLLVEAAQRLMAGAPYIRLTYRQVEKDQADWKALDPVYVIVDQNSEDVEDADFFTIIHDMTADTIMRRAQDGAFEMAAAQKVAQDVVDSKDDAQTYTSSPSDTLRQQIRDLMDSSAGKTQELARSVTIRTKVWEIMAKLDLDGDGVAERYVIWYHPHSDTVLAWYDYPMPFSDWPVTLFKFEEQAERPIDSRGIPELLFELQKLVNAQHNARLDAGQLLLSPAMQVRNSALNLNDGIKWRPGSIYKVTQIGDIAPVAHDLRILAELLREEQVTQRLAESYIGTFDATINQLQNSSERRTAAEVQAITQLASNVFGLDARMFQMNMGRSLTKIWNLYREFGQEKLYFRVMGEAKPRLALKKELGKKFDIKPAGTPANTNRATMLANAERAMGLILQDRSGRFDGSELVRVWLQLLDQNLAKKVIRSPEDAEAARRVNETNQALTESEGGNPAEAPFL